MTLRLERFRLDVQKKQVAALFERFQQCRDLTASAYAEYRAAALELIPKVSEFAEAVALHNDLQRGHQLLLREGEDSGSVRSIGPTVRGPRTSSRITANLHLDEPVNVAPLVSAAFDGPRVDFAPIVIPDLPALPSEESSYSNSNSAANAFCEESSVSLTSASVSGLSSAERIRMERAGRDSSSILSRRSPDRGSLASTLRSASVPPPPGSVKTVPRMGSRYSPPPGTPRTPGWAPVPRMSAEGSPPRAASVPRVSARSSAAAALARPAPAVTAATCSVLRALARRAPTTPEACPAAAFAATSARRAPKTPGASPAAAFAPTSARRAPKTPGASPAAAFAATPARRAPTTPGASPAAAPAATPAQRAPKTSGSSLAAASAAALVRPAAAPAVVPTRPVSVQNLPGAAHRPFGLPGPSDRQDDRVTAEQPKSRALRFRTLGLARYEDRINPTEESKRGPVAVRKKS